MNDKLISQNELAIPADLKDFFSQNAQVGSENLSSALPQLKITEGNSQNEDSSGQYAAAGTFYYVPTKEVFNKVEVSILTISKGFYALDNGDNPKPKFTQLVGGVLLESYSPFIMFVSGTRLENLWNFGKEIKPFTSSKTSPIPMFAFRVELGLEKYKTAHGINHIATYTLLQKNGHLDIITDKDTLLHLKNGVYQIQETFESFIEQKEVDRVTGEPVNRTAFEKAVEQEQVEDDTFVEMVADAQELDDDIPF